MNIVHEIQKWNQLDAQAVEKEQSQALGHRSEGSTLSLDPEERLCPKYDHTGISLQYVGDLAHTGPVVVDNCAEEHIQ